MERNESVLLLDPDPERARSLQSICESAGLACQALADGESALAAIQQSASAAVLLTQLTVPKVDAFEVIAQFRRSFPIGSGARVIALSSFADLRDTAMAHRDALGIDHILNNQVPAELLKRILRAAAPQVPLDAPAIVGAEPVMASASWRCSADGSSRKKGSIACRCVRPMRSCRSSLSRSRPAARRRSR